MPVDMSAVESMLSTNDAAAVAPVPSQKEAMAPSPAKLARSPSSLGGSMKKMVSMRRMSSAPKLPDPSVERRLKTFQRWWQANLPAGMITDLTKDVASGVALGTLIKKLEGKGSAFKMFKFDSAAPRNKFEEVANLDACLKYLAARGVNHISHISAADLYTGDSAKIVGLTWALVLHYDLADLSSAPAELLGWVASVTAGVPGIDLPSDGGVEVWEKAFCDGRVFAAIIDAHSLTKKPLYPLTTSLGGEKAPPPAKLLSDAFAAALTRRALRRTRSRFSRWARMETGAGMCVHICTSSASESSSSEYMLCMGCMPIE